MANWSREITRHYQMGLQDGKENRKPRNGLAYTASYDEGYHHGSGKPVYRCGECGVHGCREHGKH